MHKAHLEELGLKAEENMGTIEDAIAAYRSFSSYMNDVLKFYPDSKLDDALGELHDVLRDCLGEAWKEQEQNLCEHPFPSMEVK